VNSSSLDYGERLARRSRGRFTAEALLRAATCDGHTCWCRTSRGSCPARSAPSSAETIAGMTEIPVVSAGNAYRGIVVF
jgi:hypothetical protein